MIEEPDEEHAEGRYDASYTLLKDGDAVTARSVISTILTEGQLSRALHGATHNETSRQIQIMIENYVG